MTSIVHPENEWNERNLLRKEMLSPQEIFLVSFLKDQNRKAAEQLREVYGWDTEDYTDVY